MHMQVNIMDLNVSIDEQPKLHGAVCGQVRSNGDTMKMRTQADIDVSNVDTEAPSPNGNQSMSECRRSSRKKVFKFDVRDLLNKNRKAHKIQIEARIDSNAPSSSDANNKDGITTTKLNEIPSLSEEISIKKKTFMEKSAIFRRFSISCEPPKQPPHLIIPPPLLKKNSDFQDSVVINKSKHPSSLILAQMKSNDNSTVNKKKSAKNKLQTVEQISQKMNDSNVIVVDAPAQRKRGRPPKVKKDDCNVNTTRAETVTTSQSTNRNARNWKEFKTVNQLLNLKKTSSPVQSSDIKTNIKERKSDNSIKTQELEQHAQVGTTIQQTKEKVIGKSDESPHNNSMEIQFSNYQHLKEIVTPLHISEGHNEALTSRICLNSDTSNSSEFGKYSNSKTSSYQSNYKLQMDSKHFSCLLKSHAIENLRSDCAQQVCRTKQKKCNSELQDDKKSTFASNPQKNAHHIQSNAEFDIVIQDTNVQNETNAQTEDKIVKTEQVAVDKNATCNDLIRVRERIICLENSDHDYDIGKYSTDISNGSSHTPIDDSSIESHELLNKSKETCKKNSQFSDAADTSHRMCYHQESFMDQELIESNFLMVESPSTINKSSLPNTQKMQTNIDEICDSMDCIETITYINDSNSPLSNSDICKEVTVVTTDLDTNNRDMNASNLTINKACSKQENLFVSPPKLPVDDCDENKLQSTNPLYIENDHKNTLNTHNICQEIVIELSKSPTLETSSNNIGSRIDVTSNERTYSAECELPIKFISESAHEVRTKSHAGTEANINQHSISQIISKPLVQLDVMLSHKINLNHSAVEHKLTANTTSSCLSIRSDKFCEENICNNLEAAIGSPTDSKNDNDPKVLNESLTVPYLETNDSDNCAVLEPKSKNHHIPKLHGLPLHSTLSAIHINKMFADNVDADAEPTFPLEKSRSEFVLQQLTLSNESPIKSSEDGVLANEKMKSLEETISVSAHLHQQSYENTNRILDNTLENQQITQLQEATTTTLSNTNISKALVNKHHTKIDKPSKEIHHNNPQKSNLKKYDNMQSEKSKGDAAIKGNETIHSSPTHKKGNLDKICIALGKRGRKSKSCTNAFYLKNEADFKAKKYTHKNYKFNALHNAATLSTNQLKKLISKKGKKRCDETVKEPFESALNDKCVSANPKLMENLLSNTTWTTSVSKINNEVSSNSIDTENYAANKSELSTANKPVRNCAEADSSDPLKDIEKFIEDGVNLLNKDYKANENDTTVKIEKGDDSADTFSESQIDEKSSIANTVQNIANKMNDTDDNFQTAFNSFETPADTPINTPTVTPPPRSPLIDDISRISDFEEKLCVRRSHRLKKITKNPKALVGRGLVRDRERFSIKDDVESKSHYTLDEHLIDLAEVEAKNAKFLKEMEERLSNFQVIKENEYRCERVVSREAKKMICDCFLTVEEEERGELGCGEDCLNRLLMIECGPNCNVKDRCTNKRIQKFLCSPCRVFRTEKKGFGIMADIEILPGEFIMEYIGEVIDSDEFESRRISYSHEKNRHYYFMALRSDAIIDATIKGNISRFINHSCDPNAETQKWTVNGELRIGFFSRKSIMPGEEITFDYQYQRYGREAQRCYCESANCRGWIGQEPNSDEGEQVDESDDDDDDEDAQHLLVADDEDGSDSDTTAVDPLEVQKKLELAAAAAENELAPIATVAKKTLSDSKDREKKTPEELEIENSKTKIHNLLSKMVEKVAAKKKHVKRENKLGGKSRKLKNFKADFTSSKQRSLEDPDIEDEVEFLKRCGVKNQSDTLRLSRLMVRAKLIPTRLNLLEILRNGEFPCRRLFLDYHGLHLLHGWMSEDGGNIQMRLALLKTLETLPIANKTVLNDSKVMQVVRNWCGAVRSLSPSDDSSKESSGSANNSQDANLDANSNSQEANVTTNVTVNEVNKLATKLLSAWEILPQIFRIPKKERIEQMKEHEREADRQYAATTENEYHCRENDNRSRDRFQRDRFGRGTPSGQSFVQRFVKPYYSKTISTIVTGSSTNRFSSASNNGSTFYAHSKFLSKAQRRQMFAAKVAREEAYKLKTEKLREFETKCRFFGLDPKWTRPQDMPFFVNPATGQWYTKERKAIITPPSYAHVHASLKPQSTNPDDYHLPSVIATLPSEWKFAITPYGKIYYYHEEYCISQWEPPSDEQLRYCSSTQADKENQLIANDKESSDDDDDDDYKTLSSMNATELKEYINTKIEYRRKKRYQRLVDQKPISPRREEDRIYNQIEVRKYKENKEKIRKRKEEIRRKRAEALKKSAMVLASVKDALNAEVASSATNTTDYKNVTTGSNNVTDTLNSEKCRDELIGILPIQDYLLSSDEEGDIKAECNNSPLIDKIVEGDKIVDELDALSVKKPLKRLLPQSQRNLIDTLTTSEHKKRKLEKSSKRKNKDSDFNYRRLKEKFRCEIAGIIVHYLRPYLKETCMVGRIQTTNDFNHLARKLTHFVMIKELKYCESVGQTLVVTESVKNKSREFIKKYMAKYGEKYVKPANDPEFKDIPHVL